MSKQQSRQLHFGMPAIVDPAIVAMGAVEPPMFGNEPWKDPSVPRLNAVSAQLGYVRGLTAEYKVEASQ